MRIEPQDQRNILFIILSTLFKVTKYVCTPSNVKLLAHGYRSSKHALWLTGAPTNGLSQHLRSQIAKQPCLLRLRQLLKHRVDTLAPRIPDRTEPIPGHRAGHRARKVSNDEAHGAATDAAYDGPELARRRRAAALRQAFVAQHLLERAAELGVGAPLLRAL